MMYNYNSDSILSTADFERRAVLLFSIAAKLFIMLYCSVVMLASDVRFLLFHAENGVKDWFERLELTQYLKSFVQRVSVLCCQTVGQFMGK